MTLKNTLLKINAWLHLWLGIASGIIVFIISITGCILVFEHEIQDLMNANLSVVAQHEDRLLPPSAIHQAVVKAIPGKEVHSLWYHGLEKTVAVTMNSDSTVFVNPYTGEIVAFKDHEDFFHEVDELHRNLMLGREIGKPIVGWATFIFFFLLISGLIMWWPKRWNKTNRDKSFKIKWKAKFKRINYDLHNVLGFYTLLIAVLMAVTGLVMSFSWFSRTMYWATGGEGQAPRKRPAKEVLAPAIDPALVIADNIFYKVRNEIATHNKNEVIVSIPEAPDELIYACTDMFAGFWRDLYFEPATLELSSRSGKRLEDLSFPDQVRKLNYSLHVGASLGLTSKIIYFICSLVCASLPITGFYIWWGKRKKTKKKNNPRLQPVA